MSDSTTWTIGKLLEWTTTYLKEQGSETPRLDAEVLLAKARDCPRIDLYTAYTELADDGLRTRFRELVRRRVAGMPVAYLVGRREFYSLPFEVTPSVLIPRPETEFVVLRLLELAKTTAEQPDQLRIADLGTGSGILAVCAAKYVPGAEVVAVDSSPAALEVAQRNVELHALEQSVRLVRSDWFSELAGEAPFDFIVSNPPYVSDSEFAELAADVREFEPKEALVSPDEGIAATRHIITAAPEHLRRGGWLILETSPMLADRVRGLLVDHTEWAEVTIHDDLSHRPRVVSAQRVKV